MIAYNIFFEDVLLEQFPQQPPGAQQPPAQQPGEGMVVQGPGPGGGHVDPQLGELPPGVPPPEMNPEKVGAEESPEMEPLKKFYLVQKLQDLKARLLQSGITNDDLETVLKFGESFSYMVLLNLADSLLKSVESDIKSYSKLITQEAKRVAAAARKVQKESQQKDKDKDEKSNASADTELLAPNESVPFSS